MRFYGTILTNLAEVLKELGIADAGYSVDSLTLETEDGKVFDIDFEEGDYAIDEESLSFRLKSLGITFEETWPEILQGNIVSMENNYELFKNCKLKSINMYLPEYEGVADERMQESFSKIKYKVTECYLQIGGKEVIFNPNAVEIE